MPDQKTAFRNRGFKCQKCGEVRMIFGAGPEPTTCEDCGGPYVKEWDKWITELVEAVPYQNQDYDPGCKGA